MKFSDEGAYNIDKVDVNYRFLIDAALEVTAKKYSFESIILCRINSGEEGVDIIAAYNISTSPFLGSRKDTFIKTLQECFSCFPEPHVHKMSEDFKRLLKKIEPKKTYGYHFAFIPIMYDNKRYLFLGLPKKEDLEAIPDPFFNELSQIIASIDLPLQNKTLESNLFVLENYVKEVGHDIASSVQATISKLSSISRGIFEGQLAKTKAKEAEQEILGAFRIAENLGYAVDPDYNIKEARFFNFMQSAKNVIGHYQSEANERHIEIRLSHDKTEITVWGDEKAIESAMGQYLFNAIKYAYGSSHIKINIVEEGANVCFLVTDRGMGLIDDESDKIWEFGYRGEGALERHVNGAGIGLYTVKKLISAHGGSVSAGARQTNPTIVTFRFSLPKEKFLDKPKLL